MLLITRSASASDLPMDRPDSFAARFLVPALFIPCVGARDDATAAKLFEAFKHGDLRSVRSLHRHTPPDSTIWCAGDGWWLSTAPFDQPAQ